MDLVKLSRISMKHLITLHVMLDTLSVTAAAERLCLSPSSVSKTLSQLRSNLGDDLFYRHGNKLVATPLARRLGPSVQQMIYDMDQLLSQDQFDPSSCETRFSLAMRESTFELLAAKLSAHVLALAPNIRLDISTKDSIGFDGLIAGSLDFIILPHDLSQPPAPRHELVWKTLFQDEMVCLMIPDHSLAESGRGELSLDDYLSYGHIGITDGDLNIPFFEMQLAQLQCRRKISISLPDFGSAALMCHHSALLFTCSRRWAEMALQAKGLVNRALPFDYGEVAYSLVWHSAAMKDPAQRWLYEQILACSETA